MPLIKKYFNSLTQSMTWGTAFGVLANLLVIVLNLRFLKVPRGTDYRQMGEAILEGLIAFVTLIVGVPLSYKKIAGRKQWSILGIMLNLTPMPLGIVLIHLIAYWHGWTLGD